VRLRDVKGDHFDGCVVEEVELLLLL
jgi:hypothetical protein